MPVSEELAKPSEAGSAASALSTEPAGKPEVQPSENTTEETEASSTRTLVIYFSRTGEQYTVGVIDKGNTAIVAEMIAEETGADLFEVLPVDDHYPMTYNELTDVAKQEQNDKARPAYAGELPDLSGYDTVFIGAPVWWGDWPMIMYTLFENNDFSGKKLVPFSTHEGSGLSGFDKKLASACPDAEVLSRTPSEKLCRIGFPISDIEIGERSGSADEKIAHDLGYRHDCPYAASDGV